MSVGKKRSESRKYTGLVRIDASLCQKAIRLAKMKGMSTAEMFTRILTPWVDRELAKEIAKIAKEKE